MKKILAALLALILLLSLSACNNNTDSGETPTDSANSTAQSSEKQADKAKPSRILIAYFSVPENVSVDGADAVSGASIVVRDGEKLGNTEYVAGLIQKAVGGDLFLIETTETYPLDHDVLVDQAADEKAESKRPALASQVRDFEQYDTVILGYPNWWADLPMPVYSFLEQYNFDGKTIIPFVTHGGSGFSNTVGTIENLLPAAKVSDHTLSLSRDDVANSEEQVTDWALGLGITESK